MKASFRLPPKLIRWQHRLASYLNVERCVIEYSCEMQRDLRLKRELSKLSGAPPKGIAVSARQDNPYVLEATMSGPENSPYSSGVFNLELVIPDNYPFSPPSIKFLTRVYHPNIDDNGRICLDLLKMPPSGSWKPTYTIEGLLTAIQMLLEHPNPDDFLMAEIAQELVNNKEEFERKAKDHCDKYA